MKKIFLKVAYKPKILPKAISGRAGENIFMGKLPPPPPHFFLVLGKNQLI